MNDPVPAPGGWGWRPGADMRAFTPDRIRLPELPLLRFVRHPTTVLVRALSAMPEAPDAFAYLTAPMLLDRYPVTRNIAYDVLRKVDPHMETA